MAAKAPVYRLFLEGLVIVASILLAFGIDAWWDARQERERVEAALQSVADEVTQNRGEIERAAAANRRRVERLRWFIDAAPTDIASQPVDALLDAAFSVARPNTYDGGGGALSGLVASGDLSLIPDSDLRRQLLEWQSIPQEVSEDFEDALLLSTAAQERVFSTGALQAWASGDSTGLVRAMLMLRSDTFAVDALIRLSMRTAGYSQELERFLPLSDSLIDALKR